MNNFFHPSQASCVCNLLSVGCEVPADRVGNRDGAAEQIISPPAAMDFDAAQYVVDGFLFEAGNRKQFVGLAERFEFFDALNAKLIVDLFRRLWPDTRNVDQLDQRGRDFLLQTLVELHFSGLEIFVDLVREVFTDSGDIPERSLLRNRFNAVGQPLDRNRAPAVCAYPKGIRSLNFQQIGDLIENRHNLKISHSSNIQKFRTRRRRAIRQNKRQPLSRYSASPALPEQRRQRSDPPTTPGPA